MKKQELSTLINNGEVMILDFGSVKTAIVENNSKRFVVRQETINEAITKGMKVGTKYSIAITNEFDNEILDWSAKMSLNKIVELINA